jgi:hypothetical protein
MISIESLYDAKSATPDKYIRRVIKGLVSISHQFYIGMGGANETSTLHCISRLQSILGYSDAANLRGSVPRLGTAYEFAI